MARGARKNATLPNQRYETPGNDGKPVKHEVEQPVEARAYWIELGQSDAGFLASECERLYAEVITDYGDVPYITTRHRILEALANQTTPTIKGRPLTSDELIQLQGTLARTPTLAKVAKARLDALHNLVPGKPAPEIDGVDFDGKPLKLSDYRGKVVVLSFWGSWCGPCIAEIPNEKAMAERFKDRPFALLGIACDANKEDAAKVIEREQITWPQWLDGAPGEGPIAGRYHIQSYPTLMLIDAQGIIRLTDGRGESLDQAVTKCLEEIGGPASP